MLAGIFRAMREELACLGADRWLQVFALGLPPGLAILFIAIFWSGTPRDLPIAIVDLDRGQLARGIVRHLDASPALQVMDHYDSVALGKESLVDGSHYALVVIPADIERRVLLGQSPELTAFFNAQYLLVAKSLRSALLETEMTIAAEIDVAEILVGKPNISAALATAIPVRSEAGGLYNRSLDYSPFLVPGILFALYQVLISSVAILVASREFKWGGLKYWARYGVWAGLLGKMLPYTLVFTAQLMLTLFLFFGILDWPYHASLWELVPLLALFVVACQLLGIFFYALTFNPERGLSFAGAFSAPAFAFLGLTYPASDMSPFAQFWRDLMPAAHLADVYIARTSYGAGVGAFALPALGFAACFLLLPWIVERIRSRLEEYDEPIRSATGA